MSRLILNNVAKPTTQRRRRGSQKWPELQELQVGQMFFLPTTNPKLGKKLAAAAHNSAKAKGKSFSVLRYEHKGQPGYGCWRNPDGTSKPRAKRVAAKVKKA